MEEKRIKELKELKAEMETEKSKYQKITVARWVKRGVKVLQTSSIFNFGVNTTKAAINKTSNLNPVLTFIAEITLCAIADTAADNVLKDTTGGITEGSLDKIWGIAAKEHKVLAKRLEREIKDLENEIAEADDDDFDLFTEVDDLDDDAEVEVDLREVKESNINDAVKVVKSFADVAADGAVQAAMEAVEKVEEAKAEEPIEEEKAEETDTVVEEETTVSES